MLLELLDIKSVRLAAEAFMREASLLECGAGTPREEVLRRASAAADALRRLLDKGSDGPSTSRFSRILVATDGSPEARRAEGLAANLAAADGGRLMIVCVADTRWTHGPDEMAYSEMQLREELRRKVDRYLADAVSKVPAGVQVEQSRREGEPVTQILAVAKGWEADLIVMGTRGRGRLRGLLLGSTAQEVLHGTHCPVLVVPHSTVESSLLRPEPAPAGSQAATAATGPSDVLLEETES